MASIQELLDFGNHIEKPPGVEEFQDSDDADIENCLKLAKCGAESAECDISVAGSPDEAPLAANKDCLRDSLITPPPGDEQMVCASVQQLCTH